MSWSTSILCMTPNERPTRCETQNYRCTTIVV
jgi:hypothetical protein